MAMYYLLVGCRAAAYPKPAEMMPQQMPCAVPAAGLAPALAGAEQALIGQLQWHVVDAADADAAAVLAAVAADV